MTSQNVSPFEVPPSQVTAWKEQALVGLKMTFSMRRNAAQRADGARNQELYAQNDCLQMDVGR